MGQALMSNTWLRSTPSMTTTFKLVLKQPIGFVIDALGKIDSNVPFMMPERIAKTDPNTQITEVIGSGPFRFVATEWVPGSKVVYEKFTTTCRARSRPARRPAARWSMSIASSRSTCRMPPSPWRRSPSGELDLHELPSTDLMAMVEKNPDVVIEPNDKLGYQLFMVLNHLHPPFDNKAVRQAVMWGIKQDDYLVAIAGDPKRYLACPAVFGCGGANESKAGTEPLAGFDPEKAKSHAAGGGLRRPAAGR